MPYRTIATIPIYRKMSFLCRIGWHKWVYLGQANENEARLGFFPDDIEMCQRCRKFQRTENPHFDG